MTHTLLYDTVHGARCRNKTNWLNLFCARHELRSLSVQRTIAWIVGLVIGLRAGRSGVRFPERARDFSLPQFVPERITCRYPVKQQSASLRIDRSLAYEWATQPVKWRHWKHTHTVATHGMTSVKCAAFLALDRWSGVWTLRRQTSDASWTRIVSLSEATFNTLKPRA